MRACHFRPASVPVSAYLRADSDQPLLAAVARQILQGELRNSWVDPFTSQGSYHRRLIIATVMNRLSALARAHSASLNGASLLDAWRNRVDPAQIRQAVALLQHFGLDEIYNDASLPNRPSAEQWLHENKGTLCLC